MPNRDKTEDWLLPYVEGESEGDAARRAEAEARLAQDPALAEEAARMRRTVESLRAVAARTPRPEAAQVPADSWPRLRARLQPATLPPARAAFGLPHWWPAGLGAAVGAAGLAVGLLASVHRTPPPVRTASGPTPRVASVPAGTGRPAGGAAPAAPAPKVGPTPADSRVASAARAPSVPAGSIPAGPIAPLPVIGPDPFTLPPTPPPARAAFKPPPLVIRDAPYAPKPSASKRMASRDIGGASSEVVRPLPTLRAPAPYALPLPAPAPAAPPLPMAAPAPSARSSTSPTTGAGATQAAPRPLFQQRFRAFNQDANGADEARAATAGGQAQAKAMNGARQAPNPPPPAPTYAEPAHRHAARPAPMARASGASLLDAGTDALAEAAGPPLWGQTEGMQQTNETLTDLREAGLLGDLRARLEARRARSPQDLVTGRMLAAVYDFDGRGEMARRERRRLATLPGAGGEDFFQLGQSEERAGDTNAARAAYRRALASPAPPSGFHAAIARQRS